MARIRTIKPDFFLDEDLAELPYQARIGFVGLWCEADREGRLEDRPKRLKATIFPYDDVDMSSLLDDLMNGEHPYIVRYQVEGKRYIQVLNFLKHQRPHHTEKASIIPAPQCSLTDNTPSNNGEDRVGREGKGREGKGVVGSAAATKLDKVVEEMKPKILKLMPHLSDVYDIEGAKWVLSREKKMPADPALNLTRWMQGARKNTDGGMAGKGRTISDGNSGFRDL